MKRLRAHGVSDEEIAQAHQRLDLMNKAYQDRKRALKEDYLRADQELIKAHGDQMQDEMQRIDQEWMPAEDAADDHD
jgi:DNA-binding transcriptional MerR regulator